MPKSSSIFNKSKLSDEVKEMFGKPLKDVSLEEIQHKRLISACDFVSFLWSNEFADELESTDRDMDDYLVQGVTRTALDYHNKILNAQSTLALETLINDIATDAWNDYQEILSERSVDDFDDTNELTDPTVETESEKAWKEDLDRLFEKLVPWKEEMTKLYEIKHLKQSIQSDISISKKPGI